MPLRFFAMIEFGHDAPLRGVLWQVAWGGYRRSRLRSSKMRLIRDSRQGT